MVYLLVYCLTEKLLPLCLFLQRNIPTWLAAAIQTAVKPLWKVFGFLLGFHSGNQAIIPLRSILLLIKNILI